MSRFPQRSVLLCCSLGAVLVLAATAPAQDEPKCSQPVSSGSQPVASDCLFILGAAVGSQTCSPECICAPNGVLPPNATAALLCLAAATGQMVTLDCPCDDDPPPPIDPEDYMGVIFASRDKSITPGFIPGLPPTIIDSMDLSGVFNTLIFPDELGNPMVTTKTVGGCEVVTVENSFTIDPDDIPSVTNFDPGDPGTADNGSTSIDLVRMTAEGIENFAPNGDPLLAGFDGGQTVEFSWPGGDDIDGFTESIAVPPNVVLSQPNLSDSAFNLNPGQAISFSWTPGSDQDGMIDVILNSSVSSFTPGSGNSVTVDSTTVTVTCMFDDSGGSGQVPGSATGELQDSAPAGAQLTQSLTVERFNLKEKNVNAPGVSGPDVIALFATSSVSRVFGLGFPFMESGPRSAVARRIRR